MADTRSFTWTIKNFATLPINHPSFSEPFTAGGIKWKLVIYPYGYGKANGKCISVYLALYEPDHVPKYQKWETSFGLRIYDKLNYIHRDKHASNTFTRSSLWQGFEEFLPLEELNNPRKGYKLDDTVVVQLIFTSLSMDQTPIVAASS